MITFKKRAEQFFYTHLIPLIGELSLVFFFILIAVGGILTLEIVILGLRVMTKLLIKAW
jgi:hypothetical protein